MKTFFNVIATGSLPTKKRSEVDVSFKTIAGVYDDNFAHELLKLLSSKSEFGVLGELTFDLLPPTLVSLKK